MKDLLTYLRDLGHPATMSELKRGLGGRWKTLSRRVGELVTAGTLKRIGTGESTDPHRFVLLDGSEEAAQWDSSQTQHPNPRGAVATSQALPPLSATGEESSASNSTPTTGIPATAATGAGETTMPRRHPWSTIPAEPTSSPSSESTVWAASPQQLIEGGLPLSTDDLSGLPAWAQEKLAKLAAGRSESPEATIREIANFFVEEEDGRAEGRLDDALLFYLGNYC